ncbi:phage tail protein [Arsenophonus endosymbiont of Crataerina pallida]|uniref:phage tail protein n=1 Tax=Arsenophonus endosymbiont of Crataerina pallida TaxID=3066235 RepID=UPI0030CD6C34
MSYLKETAAWEDGIYQIETSDPVLGGPDGITNRPARELANRTAWLKQQLEEAEAALTAHTRSRNHPDASVSEKGFVRLSNANQSSSETEAATPKAVKIVNDRLNAVIDSAPSTLDTLNKLAKAIDNNPKFAEKLNQLLEQKLSKNDNGADIPDKNLFLKNLGLLETVDCAKNALDKRTGGTINGGVTLGQNLTISWGGRRATYHENGDITGPLWGGTLRGWLDNTFVRDIRLGSLESVAAWNGPGYYDQAGYVLTGASNFNHDHYIDTLYRRPLQKNINGQWMNVSSI